MVFLPKDTLSALQKFRASARISYLNDTVSAYTLQPRAPAEVPGPSRCYPIVEGMKVYVYYVGKARDVHANAIAAEFLKRSSRYLDCEMRELVPKRSDLFSKHASARKIFLDPAGRSVDSAQFTGLLRTAEDEARDLVFLIGGHDGLPPEWKPRADILLSLSPLTFPHELARAMLAEQIYRALTTLRGHPYPR